MPTRYIEIPKPIILQDPLTKEELKTVDGSKPETWDFKMILNKLMSNPKWGESYAYMRAQEAIEDAYEMGLTSGVMAIAEDDWTKLKEAVETPRTTIIGQMGPQVVSGFNIHPSLSRQLVKLLSPIMDAKSERPKQKE